MKVSAWLDRLTAFKERPRFFRVVVLLLLCYHLVVLVVALASVVQQKGHSFLTVLPR